MSSVSASKLRRKYSKRKVKEITKTKNTKQSGDHHQSAKSAQRKVSYQAANPLEEDDNKNKIQRENSPMCPLHGPGNDINSCKVMMEQAKSMKLTWSTACRRVAGCLRFQGAKKRPAKVEDLNDLVTNAVKVVLKPNKRKRAKVSSKSISEYEQEHYNL